MKCKNVFRKLFIFGRSISRTTLADGFVNNRDLLRELVQFAPFSRGNTADVASLTLLAAQKTFPLICQLLNTLKYPLVQIKPIETVCVDDKSLWAANQLKDLFNKYNSDKSLDHNYHLLYGGILADKYLDKLNLLEIGMGTNNPNIPSNMTESGKPGASLRAFRDFLPNSKIYGADIDRAILFQDDRIETFYIDQTDEKSFTSEEVPSSVAAGQFDIIIDDGLHSPNANLSTLIFSLDKLRSGGWFIVEDIREESLPIWNVIMTIMPPAHQAFLCKAKNAYLFVMKNP